tara:strand:+ start:18 stop:377 length:360 start_codon:yes stop_codon:yes gene_type:complete
MGINSTEVAYNFGQLGSGFCDTVGAFTPPSGKVIVAITFVGETTLGGLVADTSGYEAADGSTGTAYFSHTAVVTANGGGADATAVAQVFPAGLTIYGRWTSVTLNPADSDGGIICYFGN